MKFLIVIMTNSTNHMLLSLQMAQLVKAGVQISLTATYFIVRNHVKVGVSPRTLYCAVDTGYGLGRSLGDCRPALPKVPKYQIVNTQTKHTVILEYFNIKE